MLGFIPFRSNILHVHAGNYRGVYIMIFSDFASYRTPEALIRKFMAYNASIGYFTMRLDKWFLFYYTKQ